MLMIGPQFEPYYKPFDFYDIGTLWFPDCDIAMQPVVTAHD